MASLKQVIDTLDSAADSFYKIATKTQKKIYDEVINLAKDIETDSQGKVKQSIANLKRLTNIKAKLSALAKDKEWVDSISQFAQYFGLLQKQQNEYFSSHFPEHTLTETAKKKHQLMKQIAVQNTIDALIGDGLKANVTDKLNDILLRAVTTNEKFSDLQEELRAHLLGKDGGQGAFARYATTYATTALSQFTGQNNKLLTDDLDTEWFMYTGSNIETTREFCQHLTEKKYIHRSEIPTILTGKIDDHQCAIYEKTGLPYGMIEGTTPENFQVNCGGWNCRHQLVPVADAVVPADLRAKFDKKETQNDKKIPIDLSLSQYKDQIKTIEQYIKEHQKSAKIKGYYNSIIQAAEDGDEDVLKTLLKQAKTDISKFIAAKKSIEKKKDTATTNIKYSTEQQKVAPLKKEYKTLKDVKDTISEINKTTKWFDANIGVGELKICTKKGVNGYTIRSTGEIALIQKRAELVTSAMDKITKGKSEEITSKEADAMATYWHEITHNRNHTGTLAGATKEERIINTPFMECANEYIARETMEEFYKALGCQLPESAKPFTITRYSTAYQSDVEKLQTIIRIMQCNKHIMNSILKDKLFNGSYDSLKQGIATAIYESGGKYMIYDKRDRETPITYDDCLRLVGNSIGKSISAERFIREIINKRYQNLRRK